MNLCGIDANEGIMYVLISSNSLKEEEKMDSNPISSNLIKEEKKDKKVDLELLVVTFRNSYMV